MAENLQKLADEQERSAKIESDLLEELRARNEELRAQQEELRITNDELTDYATRLEEQRTELEASKAEVISEIEGAKNRIDVGISKGELSQVTTTIDSHKVSQGADLERLGQKKDKTLRDLERAKGYLSKMVIRAPIDGIVNIMPNFRASGSFGSTPPPFREGDRAGFWHALPGRHLVREPVRGRTAIIETAATLLGQPVPPMDGEPEAEIDWSRFSHAFPRHSVVLWLGDFAPRPAPPAWAALCRRYQTIGLRVEDPWERVLPHNGSFTAVDPLTGELLPFNTSSKASRARHAMWVRARDAYWQELFPSPVDRLTVSTEDDLLQAVIRFFRARMLAVKR